MRFKNTVIALKRDTDKVVALAADALSVVQSRKEGQQLYDLEQAGIKFSEQLERLLNPEKIVALQIADKKATLLKASK